MAFERIVMRTADGREYGPVASFEFIKWHQEGRVPADARLFDVATGREYPVTQFPPLTLLQTSLPADQKKHRSFMVNYLRRKITVKNPEAVASFCLALLNLLPCFTPIFLFDALLSGIEGLRNAKTQGGYGFALAGIIISVIQGLVVLTFIILAILLIFSIPL